MTISIFTHIILNRIKKWIIIGAAFKTLKIYRPHLNDELDYTQSSFVQLQYPNSFIQSAKIKTLKIHEWKSNADNITNINNFSNNTLLHRYIYFTN